MDTSRKTRRFCVIVIAACITGILLCTSIPGGPNNPDPDHDRTFPNIHSSWSDLRKNRDELIRRAKENGEDLLMRGKLFKLYRPTFTCPYKASRLGRAANVDDGGKWVCGAKELYNNKERNCIVYSFGVNTDSSFEADIIRMTNCSVFAYDYTVDNIATPLYPGHPRVKFEKLGLADYARKNDTRFRTLKDFMSANGHSWIDILKMDVEGAEFDSLTMLMDDFEELPFGQLQVELHVWAKNKEDVYSKTIPWLNRLEEKGLRIFYSEPNPKDPANVKIDCSMARQSMEQYEYAFINVNWRPFRNSTFTFEKLLLGSAINTFLHI